ncbi:MAG: hypothetical protein CMF72_22910 [Mameliella sp.]|nr:hypothetical protein [Mameliella sp.]
MQRLQCFIKRCTIGKAVTGGESQHFEFFRGHNLPPRDKQQPVASATSHNGGRICRGRLDRPAGGHPTARPHLGKDVSPGGFGQQKAGARPLSRQTGEIAHCRLQQSGEVRVRMNMDMSVDRCAPCHLVSPCILCLHNHASNAKINCAGSGDWR